MPVGLSSMEVSTPGHRIVSGARAGAIDRMTGAVS
jgi:hypothetical protein